MNNLFGILLLVLSTLNAVAATFTVTNTNNTGARSLRQAVLDANSAAGADAIVFDPSVFSTPQTITLASVITVNSGDNTALTITGPDAAMLTISGNNAVRIFTVSASETVSISSITFTAAVTGAISNSGDLTVTDCAFDANTNSSGGAIVGGSNALTVTNCSFTNNINTAPSLGTGGSAIFSNAASTVITNSTFSNNSATSGGGGGAINLSGGSMTITGSTFTGNSTTATGQNSFGGAIAIQGSGQLTINNCVLTGNSTTRTGGAIYYQPNSSSGPPFLVINDSTISNNVANSDSDTTGDGGGLFLTGTGSVTITGSTISGNTSNTGSASTGDGGGIDVSAVLNLTNSTISGNSAGRNGGGIYASGTSGNIVTIDSCTIVNNTAAGVAGGVSRASVGNPVNLRNSIFANNTDNGTSPNISGSVVSQGYNLIKNITGATFTGDTATNVTGVDPNLGPLQDNGGPTLTHALLAGSPAVDKGGTSEFTIDQRGSIRTFDNAAISNGSGGNGTDIGAFEVELPVVTALVSRRVHGAAGAFDINLLAAPIVTECRAGGDYQVIVTFANPVSVSGLSVMSSDGLADGTQAVNGAVVTVDLTAVINAQTVGVTLINANDGLIAGDVFIPLGVLIGDSNGDAAVNSGDAVQTRNRSGQTTDGANFRSDVNVDGVVNSGDTSAVRSRSGTFLP